MECNVFDFFLDAPSDFHHFFKRGKLKNNALNLQEKIYG